MACVYVLYHKWEVLEPRDFEFWGNARKVARKLKEADWDVVEDYILEELGEDFEEDKLNSIFEDGNYIARILGYDSWDDLVESRRNNS